MQMNEVAARDRRKHAKDRARRAADDVSRNIEKTGRVMVGMAEELRNSTLALLKILDAEEHE